MNSISPNNQIATLFAQNQLGSTNEQLKKVFDRLATAQRINQASDDAAGLAITERMLSQLRGLEMAERNTNDGASVAQLADAYTSGINDDLQRMRELAVQSANGTLGDNERAMLNEEFTQLQENISGNIAGASFNGQPLLSADGSITIQAGANAGDGISIATLDLAANNGAGIGSVLDGSFNISSQTSAQNAIGELGGALGKVNSARATIGATASRLDNAVGGIQDIAMAQAESRSRIIDADYARETSRFTGMQIRQQAGTALLGQASNMNAAYVVSLLGR